MLHLSTQVFNAAELPQLINSGVQEFLIEPSGLSRLGQTPLKTAQEMLTKGGELNLKTVLVCDRLVDEQYFASISQQIEALLLFSPQAIRIMDLGLARFLKNKFPGLALQLILDAGFHNTPAILAALKYWQAQVEKIILSPELPSTSVKELSTQIASQHLDNGSSSKPLSLELLGLGRILMFYSPRKLVSPLFEGDEEQWITVSSEESQNRTFDTFQSSAGTLMFYSKDLCLLEYSTELPQIGVEHVRVDRHHLHNAANSLEIISLVSQYLKTPHEHLLENIKVSWGRPCLPGFFKANRSSAPFVVLKNQKLQGRNNNQLGNLVEVKKDKYCAVHLSKRLAEFSSFYWLLPSGQRLSLNFNQSDENWPIISQKLGVLVLPYQHKLVSGAVLFGE